MEKETMDADYDSVISTYYGDEQVVAVIMAKVDTKVADHLLKSFPRGDHFTTQEVQSALEKFGYSHTSADSLAPLYTNHLIGRGIWQGTPSPGVYLAVKGLLPYTPDTETAEQKAARAEEERRAHTDMMGGAH